MLSATGIFYVTNGNITPISAFEANQVQDDEAAAYGICDLLDDDVQLIKATKEGAIISSTPEQALSVHNSLFALGPHAPKMAQTTSPINTGFMRTDFISAASSLRPGYDLPMAVMAPRHAANDAGMIYKAA